MTEPVVQGPLKSDDWKEAKVHAHDAVHYARTSKKLSQIRHYLKIAYTKWAEALEKITAKAYAAKTSVRSSSRCLR